MAITDTHPAMAKVHLEILRKASDAQRLNLVSSLTKTIFSLSWQGLRERYPHESLQQRVERFVCLLYKDRDLGKKFAGQYIKKHPEEPHWITP